MKSERNTYFDNASTSHPKSDSVLIAIQEYLVRGGSYARSAYPRVVENTRMVERCRTAMARLIGARRSDNVVFGASATWASNAILQRMNFSSGDIIYHSPMEHNAVMRPLNFLAQNLGVELRVLPSGAGGVIDVQALKDLDMKGVRLVVVNHASNVNGLVQPLAKIREMLQGVELMVDASVSLGQCEVNVEAMGIDYLIFTAHKSLGGVTGLGGFYARENIEPFIYGGTGSRSDSFLMPEDLPDAHEAGTPNLVGIAAFQATLSDSPMPKHERGDFLEMTKTIASMDGVELLFAPEDEDFVELFSFTHNVLSPSTLADRLSGEFNIDVRAGLHCAPLAHRTLGSFPMGSLRVSLSPTHTKDDLNYFVHALTKILE